MVRPEWSYQLNSVDKSLLVQMFLNQQEQLESLTAEIHSLNEKMQLMMEQLILSKKERFGRSSEKMDDFSQISFMEVDGNIVFFNEAEAVSDLDAPEPDDLEADSNKKQTKTKGKKEKDMSGFDVNVIPHYMTEEELTEKFGKNGWKQLPDAISRKYHSSLPRLKWMNIISACMPVKRMEPSSRQNILRVFFMAVRYLHPLQQLS